MRFERKWSKQEEKIAWEMHLKRKSYSEIGNKLGRSRGSVSTKISNIKKKKLEVEQRASQFTDRPRFLDQINISERVKKMFRTDPVKIKQERAESAWNQTFKGF